MPSAEDATAPDGPTLLVSVPETHFRVGNDEDDAAVSDRMDELYDFVVDLYAFLCASGNGPRYVYGPTGEDERRIADPDYSIGLDRVNPGRSIRKELGGVDSA